MRAEHTNEIAVPAVQMTEVSPRASGRWLTVFDGTNVLSTTTCQQLCWGMTHFPWFPFKRFGYVFSAYILE